MTAALTKELADITGNDRYQFLEPNHTLKAILAKLRPEPVREPLLPPKKRWLRIDGGAGEALPRTAE